MIIKQEDIQVCIVHYQGLGSMDCVHQCFGIKIGNFFSQLHNSKLVLSSLQDTRTLICVIKISDLFLMKLGTCIIILIHTF